MAQTRAAAAGLRRVLTEPEATGNGAPLSIGLSAVIVAANIYEPRVLTIRFAAASASGAAQVVEGLPSGPLEAEHRTLEIGLRAWVERQTSQRLGYVEQLYTFGDRDRVVGEAMLALPALIVAYLALAREANPAGSADAEWRSWYRYFPWEDWRAGKPLPLAPIEAGLGCWAAQAEGEAERRLRTERLGLAFGLHGAPWNEELVLERYELLYEAGLVAEAARDFGRKLTDETADPGMLTGAAMALDHRRILATAIGRLRGKIKYRPVVFELMPPAFTLLQLQRTVEALAGVLLHKQNFRRLVEQQGLVEETGAMSAATGGRPARLVRFRREVLLERPAPGLRLRAARRAGAG
ncbi:MAG TPA: hypothetical protein VHY35_01385 [Stellaceae bacterium]|jgi:hypothetical protein|nr:hypothetical protein [Stellaceae bacterium]